MYQIRFARGVEKDLRKLKARDQRIVLASIEDNLIHQPALAARNKKILSGLVPPWTAEPPVWELRVGEYRVFYDVSAEEKIVFIRAIRRKPAGKITEEIL